MKITGRVVDHKTEEPLQNVSVIIEQDDLPTKTGTLTNEAGYFTLDSPLLDGSIYNKVAFSHVGYDTVKLDTRSANTQVYLTSVSEVLPTVTIVKILKSRKAMIVTMIICVIISTLLIFYISKMPQIKNL